MKFTKLAIAALALMMYGCKTENKKTVTFDSIEECNEAFENIREQQEETDPKEAVYNHVTEIYQELCQKCNARNEVHFNGEAYLSADLRELLDRVNKKCQEENDMFDSFGWFWINAQDWVDLMLKSVDVKPIESKNRATADIELINCQDITHIRLTLVREEQGWMIDDFEYCDEENPVVSYTNSLRAELTKFLNQ